MEQAVFEDGQRGRLVLAGTAQGLLSEADELEALIREEAPSVVAIQLDPELVEGVGLWEPVEPSAPEDLAYVAAIERFGDVELPAPDVRRAVAVAAELEATVAGIDVSEMAWAQEYTRRISGMALMRRALRMRRGHRKLERLGSPEAVCRALDARANRPPFDRLEQWREREMAANIRALMGPDTCVVAAVEIARMRGVRRALREASDGLQVV